MARLTLWGFYQYDPELFSGVVLPEGMVTEDFIDLLLERCGQLYPYHQAHPMLKRMIGRWFTSHLEDFKRMYEALTAEYDPIENYNRHENSHRDYDHSGNDKITNGGTDTLTNSGTDSSKSESDSVITPDLTDTTNISAFDASSFVPRDQVKHTGDQSNHTVGEGSLTYGKKESTQYGRTESTDYGHNIDDTFFSHIHGNIGVTTNQQMITQEMEMRKLYNIYDVICTMFEDKFIVQYYA